MPFEELETPLNNDNIKEKRDKTETETETEIEKIEQLYIDVKDLYDQGEKIFEKLKGIGTELLKKREKILSLFIRVEGLYDEEEAGLKRFREAEAKAKRIDAMRKEFEEIMEGDFEAFKRSKGF